jgi:hypothetical protein
VIYFRYKGVAFDCVLPVNPWLSLNASISVTTAPCEHPKNNLQIHQGYTSGFQTNFSVCLSGALKHNISAYHQLVEWIELNTLLGARHFFIYNYTGGSELLPYLHYYEQKGVLTVLPFSLPMKLTNQKSHSDFRVVWNYGQEILIQDCLQRNLLIAKRLVYLDLDEFLIPHNPDTLTWQQMIRDANCSKQSGLFVGRNANFPLDVGNVIDDSATTLHLQTLLHNERHEEIYEAFKRTKYIAVPERMLFVRVHYKDTYWMHGTVTCRMSVRASLLHHYRDNIYRDRMVTDNAIPDKYSQTLKQAVRQVYMDVSH